jgi:DNA polymerase III gamma/tau subunit
MHNNILTKHPAHLWIGDDTTLKNQLIFSLQKIFCKENGCLKCNSCTQISQEQHPNVTWIAPQDSYNLEDIDTVLEQVRFKLDNNQHKFFIFQEADELTPSCSNRLLKTVEEPHAGYHFIFLASRIDTILPTIISRCLMQEFNNQIQDDKYEELIEIFTQNNLKNPQQFLKIVDKLQINPQNSKDVIDYLFAYFYNQLKKIHTSNNTDLGSIQKNMDKLLILKNEMGQLPLSGATKIFWKNIFIRFHILQA